MMFKYNKYKKEESKNEEEMSVEINIPKTILTMIMFIGLYSFLGYQVGEPENTAIFSGSGYFFPNQSLTEDYLEIQNFLFNG